MRQQIRRSLFFSMLCVCREIQFSETTKSSDLLTLRLNYLKTKTWLMPLSSFQQVRGWVHPGQSITRKHRDRQDKQPCTHTLKPKDNLERPINLTAMLSDCGRKLEYPGEPTHAQGEHANSMHKDPGPGFEPRTFLLPTAALHNYIFVKKVK